ncbi:MAG: long-chain-fatty-acid--CoA ligase [Candidatus Bathyarchaeota archaeon]
MIKGFPSTMNDEWQLNLWKLIMHAGRVHRTSEVISYRTLQGGQVHRLNYGKVYERVCAMANALQDLGVKPGDRVAMLGWNDHRYFESYFSIPGLGAVMLQLNLRLHPGELIHVVGHAEARALFVDDTLLPLAEMLAKVHKFDFFVVMSDKPLNQVSTKLEPIYGYEELVNKYPSQRNWEEIDEKSAACACYTSGTTGLPKGVYYSHRALILHAWALYTAVPVDVDDSFLVIVPLFHANAWGTPFVGPLVGCKLVLPGRYTPEHLVDIMLKEKITSTAGAPAIFIPILEVLRKMKPKPDFKGLRAASGATEPPLAMQKGLAEFGIRIIHAYGATETTPLLTLNHPKPEIKSLSVEQQWDHMRKQGYPAFGVEVKLVDPSTGKELPWDGKSVGEAWWRGPWVIKEYYNDPRSKEQCTPDGWWKSGDAGFIDELGYFKLVDRIKDLIKSGGEWISSVDVENTLMAHPAVLEAAVVGLPHPRWEERPLALVVLREEYKEKSKEELESELKEHLSKRFSKWQIPDKILFVSEIPKTSVGKFDKKVIREQHKDIYIKE